MSKLTISQINKQKELIKANVAYRKGEAIVEDNVFDALIDEYTMIYGEDDFINEIGFEDASDERMEKLPIIMGSMNKIKTIEEYKKWLKSKEIHEDEIVVLSAKYDGLSLCTDETYAKKAWTRGNGISGQKSSMHYERIGILPNNEYDAYCFGEVIMKRDTFARKYSEKFANPRNMVSGLMNHKKPSNPLADCDYIRYGVKFFSGLEVSKLEQMEFCNQLNSVPVMYKSFKASEITLELITNLFEEWSKDYEIDGIIIDVNDPKIRKKLGRETSKPNPAYARAFKGNFEEVMETTVNDIIYQVSKSGKLAPIGQVTPVSCDGATVSNVTLYNAKTVRDLGIAPGARIKIKRSGMVIPKVVEVLTPMAAVLPTHCPECGKELSWNETEVDLMCINPECPAIRITKLYSFFKIIDADSFSEGTIDAVVTDGYDSIKKILLMSLSDFEKLDRVGKKRAENIYEGIHSKLTDISLPILQHASGFFQGLGSKKLALVEKVLTDFDFITHSKTPIMELTKIDGFSTKSANMYMNGIHLFNEWVKDIPCKLAEPKEEPKATGNQFENQVVVFTGYRNKEAEDTIIAEGGSIGKKVNKKATMLVMKTKGSGTSKEKDALNLGITILDKDEFENML
ncbi:MAG: hypothetical protein PF487_03840 [Bacteroidales bacterium]|nr:hypothetical protein [Bacteroidales bacterium]